MTGLLGELCLHGLESSRLKIAGCSPGRSRPWTRLGRRRIG